MITAARRLLQIRKAPPPAATDAEVKGHFTPSPDAGVSPHLANPVALNQPFPSITTVYVNAEMDDYEPPHEETRPSFEGVIGHDSLPITPATGHSTPAHPDRVAMIPSGAAQGVELPGHRKPRRVMEDSYYPDGMPAWVPNSGYVMLSPGPLADQPGTWEHQPARWESGSPVSVAPTNATALPAPTAHPARGSSTARAASWESSYMVDQ